MDIRKKYLDFFAKKGHEIEPSAPLVPQDASLLFVNAGMVPFKDIFTQKVARPNPPRRTSAQTCIRAGGKHNDLDNVGYTRRHHTFFEMLGNFSFGDYFKEKAIAYAFEFVTNELNLPKDRLYVTVHDDDDEAFALWEKYMPKERIYRFGDKDNFWQMGETGPCGPCSEIFYDQGESFDSTEDYMGGEGDRFLEIWNLVFMQYNRGEDGKLSPLPAPSIDTGMGLERITAILEGKKDNFDSSLFMPIIERLADLAKQPYVYEKGASYRIIADHIRSAVFLLAQGVGFDKEGRGYVLRRIVRRALRHGYLLGFKSPFMYQLVDVLGQIMGEAYPYIIEKADFVKEQIRQEEERFLNTIEKGMAIYEEALKSCEGELFSGKDAFKLYDTYGFPLDLTNDMLKDLGKRVDEAEFDACMAEQKARARAAWKGSGDADIKGDFKALEHLHTEFLGYDSLKCKARVLALLDDEFRHVHKVDAGVCYALLDKSPFYATGGGQMSDSGLFGPHEVLEVNKYFGLNLAKIKLNCALSTGDEHEASVDEDKRAQIARHHSATHLLHLALKKVLGDGVNQAGSLVEANKLRFDFTYPKALSKDQLDKTQALVNEYIANASEAKIRHMSKEEALREGAVALFGEKYDEGVRVVSLGESLELCGGTHAKNTGELGCFFIVKESGVSAGVRRIEAVVSKAALDLAKQKNELLLSLENELKNKDLLAAITKLKEENKTLKNQLKTGPKKALSFKSIKGVSVCIEQIDSDIKTAVDEFKNSHEKAVCVLISIKDDKISLAIGCKNVPLKAGKLISSLAPLVGGKGGGRDDFAMAGGKDTSKVAALKDAALEEIQKEL